MTELIRLGAAEVVSLIRRREVTPIEVVEASIQRIEAVDGKINALPIRMFERRNQQVRTLSGGEQQMVALGRALMARPKLLLLDEPSGGLSPQFVNEIGTIISALKDDGATILMIEQNLGIAFKVADRFIIMRDGLVADEGTVADYADDHHEVVRSIYL